MATDPPFDVFNRRGDRAGSSVTHHPDSGQSDRPGFAVWQNAESGNSAGVLVVQKGTVGAGVDVRGGGPLLILRDASGKAVFTVAQTGAYTGQGAASTSVFPFSLAGALTTQTGQVRIYNDSGATLTIVSVRASVGTAPVGSSIIVDVNKDGTTIFTTQANRPTIAAAGNTSGKVTNMDVTTIADGSYFTVDIDQIGSGTAGSDLSVQLLLSS